MKYYLNKIERKPQPAESGNLRLHLGEKIDVLPKEMWEDFISRLTPSDFLNYPSTTKFKERLAHLNGVKPENIFVGAGSDRVLSAIFNAFLNPGDIVATSKYHFPMYDVYAAQNNASVELLKQNSIRIVLERKSANLIVLGNPNSFLGDNPSYTLLEDASNYGCPVIIDQAYKDFGCTDINVADNIDKNLIFVNSFSKCWGGAGARVGYCAASEKTIKHIEKYRDMFEITGASIKYCEWALDNEEYFRDWRAKVLDTKRRLGDIAIIPKNGNWVFLDQTQFKINGADYKHSLDIPELSFNPLMRIGLSCDYDLIRDSIEEIT